MAYMFTQLRCVSGQLISIAILVGKGEVPAGSTQTSLNCGGAARGRGTGLTRTRAGFAGIRAGLAGAVLRYGPTRTE